MTDFNLALYQARAARAHSNSEVSDNDTLILREYMFGNVRTLGKSICDLATFPHGSASALIVRGFIPGIAIAMDSTRTLHISIRSDGVVLFYTGFVQEGEISLLHGIGTTEFSKLVEWAATTVAMFEYLPRNEPLPLAVAAQPPPPTDEPAERTRVIDLD